MKLLQARALVDAVLENAPGPVSVYVVDDHGELAAKVADDPVERASFDPFFTFFKGGVAAFEDGHRIGAIGVSGLPSEEDERLALEANAKAGLSSG